MVLLLVRAILRAWERELTGRSVWFAAPAQIPARRRSEQHRIINKMILRREIGFNFECYAAAALAGRVIHSFLFRNVDDVFHGRLFFSMEGIFMMMMRLSC